MDSVSVMIFVIFLIILSISAIVIVSVVKMMKDQQRQDALRPLASTLNMSFVEGVPLGWEDQHGLFRIFDKGHHRMIYNKFEGAIGDIKVFLFDYDYKETAGKNSGKHRQTVLLCTSPSLNLPEFEMVPEGFFHKVKDLFTSEDIDFENYPEFSTKYYLTGRNEQAVRELFDAKKLEFFTQVTGLCVEGNEFGIIVYRSDKRIEPVQLESMFKSCMEVVELFKQ